VQEGLLIAAVVLNSLILLAIVIAALVVIQRIGRVASAAEAALRGIESLATRAERELGRVDDVLRSADRLLSGTAAVEAGVKAARSSRNTIVGILAGVKEALRVLKKPAGEAKED
jgi:hypothetical protein